MAEQSKQLEEIREELQKYASGDAIPSLGDVLQECNAVVTRSILCAFGMQAFADKVGGNVTTLHNFVQGITATNADYVRFKEYNHPYDSDVVRPLYASRQKLERSAIINSDAVIQSGYTGKILPHNSSTHLEHIVPVAEIESMPENFLYMNQEDRINLAYISENLCMLEASINHSKIDKPIKEWMKTIKKGEVINNASRFGVDVGKTIAADKAARSAIHKEQIKARIEKQAPELLKTGIAQGTTLGIREVIAIILIDFNDEAIVCTQKIMLRYQRKELSFSAVIDELKTSLINLKNRILEEWKFLLDTFVTGGISGFVSNLMVFLINNFITTAKHVVSIIRECVYALINSGKILISGQYKSYEEKIAAATDVLVSSSTVCLTILLGEAIKTYLVEIPLADEISQAISAMIVGVAIVIISYYFQSMQAELAATTASVGVLAIETADMIDVAEKAQKKTNDRMNKLEKSTGDLLNLKF